jgi:hypothetical protein
LLDDRVVHRPGRAPGPSGEHDVHAEVDGLR